ncbi:MAG: DUF3822 family protein [Sphingobacteriaceae bacterium]
MSHNRLNYFDPDFDPGQANDYNLLLIISLQEFSFAVIHAESEKLMVWGTNFLLEELADPKELWEVFFARYHKVKLALQPENFVLVPKDLFNKDALADFGRFLNLKKGDQLLTDEVLNGTIVSVFSADNELLTSLHKFFPGKHLTFNPKSWIKVIADHEPKDFQLHLKIESGKLEILKFNDGKLQFYNQFTFVNSDELVYFVSFTLEQLHLETEQIQVILSGDIHENDANYARLNIFFPNVVWFDKPLLQIPTEIKFHEIVAIASLNICG